MPAESTRVRARNARVRSGPVTTRARSCSVTAAASTSPGPPARAAAASGAPARRRSCCTVEAASGRSGSPGRAQEVELEGAEHGIGRRPRVEEAEPLADERVDLGTGLAPEDHAVGELEDVGPGCEAVEVAGKAAQHPEELCAQEK